MSPTKSSPKSVTSPWALFPSWCTSVNISVYGITECNLFGLLSASERPQSQRREIQHVFNPLHKFASLGFSRNQKMKNLTIFLRFLRTLLKMCEVEGWRPMARFQGVLRLDWVLLPILSIRASFRRRIKRTIRILVAELSHIKHQTLRPTFYREDFRCTKVKQKVPYPTRSSCNSSLFRSSSWVATIFKALASAPPWPVMASNDSAFGQRTQG